MSDDKNNGLDPEQHCTVEMYAAAKKLPIDYLQSRGIYDCANPKNSRRCAMTIPYLDARGALIRQRLRLSLSKSDSDARDKRFAWGPAAREASLALYGLETLSAAVDLLLIAEGESDQQTAHFKGYSALGVPGATMFKPDRDDPALAPYGKIVVLMEPGEGGKAFVRQLAKSSLTSKMFVGKIVGAKDISEAHIKNADAPADFDAMIKDAIERAQPIAEVLAELGVLKQGPRQDTQLPDGFRYGKRGTIERNVEKGWVFLCTPLRFIAETRDMNQRSWGLLIEIDTADNHVHRIVVPRELIVGGADELRRILANHGVRVAPGRHARDAFEILMSLVRPHRRALVALHVGWHNRTFVLPDSTFGPADQEPVAFQSPSQVAHAFKKNGTIEDWQRTVAEPAIGNSRLVLAISAAFAPPLLQVIGLEGGGLHFRGPSSIGKTTMLYVAGSVWGGGGLSGYATSWRATDNALENIALAHCDCLLTLDELGESEGAAAGKSAYMLSNGVSKSRSSRSAELKPVSAWRLLLISTGEIGLAEKLSEDRKRVTGGQEVRVLDIVADAGKGLGVFENLHSARDAGTFAESLKASAGAHYGHAARAFVDRLAGDIEGARDLVQAKTRAWMDAHGVGTREGQVRRAAQRFALIAAAGELAAEWGIVPWPAGEADKAAKRCFDDWLAARGGLEPSEVRRGIDSLRHFLQSQGPTRLQPLMKDEREVPNRAGFRKADIGGEKFLLYPAAFQEACGGVDPDIVARALLDRGWLVPGENGRLQKKERLNGHDVPQRVYVVAGAILGDDDAGN